MKKTQSLGRTNRPLKALATALGLVSLALLPLLGTGCTRKAEATPEEHVQTAEVITANPQCMDLTRDIEQPGYLRAYEQTPIYTKIAGFAEEPKVDRGDWVKKGDLLVKLFVPEVVQDLHVKEARVLAAKADLKQAESQAKAAEAAVDAAKADVNAKNETINSADAQVVRWKAEDVRSRRLMGQGVFDQQTADEVYSQLKASEALKEEARAKWMSAKASHAQAIAVFHKAEADVEVARANVKVAEAAYAQWKDWLGYAELRSPFDGVVTTRNVHTGHFLQPSTSGTTSKSAEPLFMVMRTDIMRMTVDVPEIDAGFIKVGDRAVVRFQARNGEVPEMEATVTRDSFALDDKARTLTVEIFLNNPDRKLMPGMYANVTILARIRHALTLPADAIQNDILADGDRSYCYVVEDGKVHKIFLEVGAHCDEGVQVLRKQRPGGKWEKLTGKEAVVIVPKATEDPNSRLIGPKALQDGQEVQVKSTATP